MKAREAGTIACKVLAVYALLLAVEAFRTFAEQVVPMVQQASATGASISGLLGTLFIAGLPLVLTAVGAWALWWKAGRIGGRMVLPDENAADNEAGPGPDAQAVTTLVFAVTGALILVWNVPSLLRLLLSLIIDRVLDPDAGYGVYWSARVASSVVRVGIGIWLLFGARNIAKAILWLRVVGRSAKEEDVSK